MTKVLLKRSCSVGRKGDTVIVSDAYAQRLNESGAGRILGAEKPQAGKTTAKKQADVK